ncbi:MAG: hypothetical protein R3B60_03375 [Candidatus Paceibacterota bacterium]
MLKLISLNIELDKHYSRIIDLLDRENPDVIALQEVPKEFLNQIEDLGYKATFTTRKQILDGKGKSFEEGLVLASKFPCETVVRSYFEVSHKTHLSSVPATKRGVDTLEKYSYIMAKIKVGGEIFNIVTTHLIVTPDGLTNELQTKVVTELLQVIKNEESHMICGDFNMPRGYNGLYELFTKKYADQIPLKYKSSLDKNLHRCGNMQLEQPIFDEYMVDYLFTQPPYRARNVRLEFGVSDHAAVIAEIYK